MTRNRTHTEPFLDKQIRKQHTKYQIFSVTHGFQVTEMSYRVHKRHYCQPIGTPFRRVNPLIHVLLKQQTIHIPSGPLHWRAGRLSSTRKKRDHRRQSSGLSPLGPGPNPTGRRAFTREIERTLYIFLFYFIESSLEPWRCQKTSSLSPSLSVTKNHGVPIPVKNRVFRLFFPVAPLDR